MNVARELATNLQGTFGDLDAAEPAGAQHELAVADFGEDAGAAYGGGESEYAGSVRNVDRAVGRDG